MVWRLSGWDGWLQGALRMRVGAVRVIATRSARRPVAVR